MNNHPEEPRTNSAPSISVGQVDEADAIPKDKLKPDPPLPLITAFVSNPKVTPSAFIKVLKAEKIKRFKKEDEDRASTILESNDPNGERLWALMSQASLPDAVDRWIWTVAQDRLRSIIGLDFDPLDTDASRVLRTLCSALRPKLKSKEKNEQKSAMNWFRIGICWLTKKRSIQPWLTAEAISSIFFTDTKGASGLVNRAISKGRTNEIRLAVATVMMGNDVVARTKSERDDERRLSNSLRIQLTDEKKKNENLVAELEAAHADLANKKEALEEITTRLENERHHWGHDLSETKAGQRVLLGERMAPLLSDAIDALEIEPPAPEVALKRIKAVLSIIHEAKS